MVSLPQFGFQAVILGMSAFKSNVKTVESGMASIGRSVHLLERNAAGIDTGLASTTERYAKLAEAADLANRRMAAIGTGTFATTADRERANLAAIKSAAKDAFESRAQFAREFAKIEIEVAEETRVREIRAAKAITQSVVDEHKVQIRDATAAARAKQFQADLNAKDETRRIADESRARLQAVTSTAKTEETIARQAIADRKRLGEDAARSVAQGEADAAVKAANAVKDAARQKAQDELIALRLNTRTAKATEGASIEKTPEARAAFAIRKAEIDALAALDAQEIRSRRDKEIALADLDAKALKREVGQDAARQIAIERRIAENEALAASEKAASEVGAARGGAATTIVDRRRLEAEEHRAAKVAADEEIALTTGFSQAQIKAAKDTEVAVVDSANRRFTATKNAANETAAAEIATARKATSELVAEATLRTAATIANEEAQTAAIEAEAAKQAAARSAAIGAGIAVVAAVAAAFAAATFAAAKYEKELINVSAIGELTAKGQAALSATVLDLGSKSTVGIGEMTKGAGDLVKAGLDINKVLGPDGALKTLNDLTVAAGGELKVEDAANAIVIGLNAFSKTGATAEQVANAMTAAVQKSALGFNDFSVAMRQGANTAALAGLTIDQFSAAVGVVGQTIKSGSEVGSGLRQMFLKLIDPSTKNEEIMRKYGISLFDAQGKIRPFRDFLIDLNAQFSDSAVAAGKLTEAERDQALASLAGGRSIKVVAALLNGGVEAYDKMLAATSDQTTIQRVSEEQLKSTAAQWKIFTNNIEIVAVQIGEKLLPVLNDLIKNALAAVKAFPASAVGQFGAAVVDLTGQLFNALGTIKDFIAQNTLAQIAVVALAVAITAQAIPAIIAFGVQMARTAVVVVGALLAEIAPALIAVLGPIGLLGAAFGTVAFLIVTHNKEIMESIGGLIALFGYALAGFGDALSTVPGIGTAVSGALKAAGENLKQFGLGIRAEADKASKEVKDLNDELTKAAKRPLATEGDQTEGFVPPNEDKIAKAKKRVEELFSDLGRSLDDIARKSLEKTVQIGIDTNKKLAEAVHEGQLEIRDANRKAEEDARDLANNGAAKRNADNRKEALNRILSTEDLARKQQLDREDEAFKTRRESQDNFNKDVKDAAERAFKDQLSAQELQRKQGQEIEDEAYKNSLDRAKQAFTDRQNAEEEALKRRHDILLDNEKFSQDQVERERQVKLDLIRLEREYVDKVADITEDLNKKRTKAAHDEEVRHTTAVRNAAHAKTPEAQAAALAAEDRLHAKKLDAAKNVGQDQLIEAQRDFDRHRAEVIAKQAEDAQTAILKRNADIDESKLKQQLDDEDTALKLAHEQQLRTFTEAQDAAELTRKQQRETDDYNFKLSQATAEQAFKDQLDAKSRQDKIAQDDEDLARKQKRELDDAAFKQGQDDAKRALDAKLDAEDEGRRRDAIFRERDDRIRAIGEALDEKQRKIRESAADELATVQRGIDDQIHALNQKLADQLPDILDGTNGVIAGRSNQLTELLFSNMEIVRQEAFAAAQELARALQVNDQLRASMAATRAGVPKAPRGQQTSVSFAEGGTVPGPIGAPVAVIAHGGERFAGVHGQRGHLMTPAAGASAAAVQAAVTNVTTNFNVNAHYGRVQSEGSLLMDLRALAAMRR